ncbi:hypothetical protein SLA2020_190650 [Shorea laevis]
MVLKLGKQLPLHLLLWYIISCKLEHLQTLSINMPMHSLFILFNPYWPPPWLCFLTTGILLPSLLVIHTLSLLE